ncbi:preprotein translocase subunit SECY, chloroplastic [Lathyrus oleraceus]|uniref:Preprotein translocase subunit SECY, chloroplastic n=2 Tax=Pisum sativum TaxID=3888 RepID=SECY_PEA|nr:preprotein translocase subunit SECY, chloroplastic [Pisum sativum]Q9XQU4.1 RecName: Full=Preprotein translocase subunit SECY, chloroplastic; AltName: Full=CpSecY; Flags: Precursor [Pisum sativum]AAD33936.1 secY [Pisum sativum]KAI5441195.1 hypothetical protein KIW84_010595 [Pisum sativum]
MLITVRDPSPTLRCSSLNRRLIPTKHNLSPRLLRSSFRQHNLSLRLRSSSSSNLYTSCDLANFDPLGINPDLSSSSTWRNLLTIFQTSSQKDKPRGVAAAIEDSSIDFGDFFNGPLPGKFLKLLGFLALSRLGVYIPLGGVNRDAFLGNLDQNSLLTTLDSFSGGGIGRLGICSLGIVPFINAQIVFQLLAQVYPKLQDLQKKEGEAGRKKLLQYTRYASVGFAIVQAIGQVLFLRPYANDFTTEWALTSVILLTLGSVFTTYIGEQITELKLGNGTSLLIFTNIISYLPASFGRTFSQAFSDANYVGLVTIIVSFFLLVLGIVYVQEAERKIPINYASRFTSKSGGIEKSAYLPFKVNSSGVMPIIFSTSSLALPGTLARFTGLSSLKTAAVALNPGGSFYLPFNILLIAFFNYYYTFLQLDPDDVSEQLKRQGASIPLVRPGKSTATFIKTVLSRISVLGSTFLAILAAGPAVVEQTAHLTAFRGFAGTSILILVGCATDTARKVRAEIISQKYKNIELYDFDKY